MPRIICLLPLVFLPAVTAIRCMHNFGVSDITYDERGVAIGGGQADLTMGVQNCDSALDRCVNFAMMSVADFMKLDVGTKDGTSAQIKDHNGNVWGRTCMSQSDCDKIKAQKADICEGTGGGDYSCCCSTDECTGSGVGGLSIVLPILAVVTYVVSH